MEAIAKSGVNIGVDPLGGSGIDYWPEIAKQYGIKLTVVNPVVDASFAGGAAHDGIVHQDDPLAFQPAAIGVVLELDP